MVDIFRPTLYVETSVIGYLTSRQARDIVVAGHQQVTRDWWKTASDRFELFASELVVQECAEGDESASAVRLATLREVPLLRLSVESEHLAVDLVARHLIPAEYYEDALHIAMAAVHGMNYLVTWNFRHIANASLRGKIEEVCRDLGYDPPIICSPEELTEPEP